MVITWVGKIPIDRVYIHSLCHTLNLFMSVYMYVMLSRLYPCTDFGAKARLWQDFAGPFTWPNQLNQIEALNKMKSPELIECWIWLNKKFDVNIIYEFFLVKFATACFIPALMKGCVMSIIVNYIFSNMNITFLLTLKQGNVASKLKYTSILTTQKWSLH